MRWIIHPEVRSEISALEFCKEFIGPSTPPHWTGYASISGAAHTPALMGGAGIPYGHRGRDTGFPYRFRVRSRTAIADTSSRSIRTATRVGRQFHLERLPPATVRRHEMA
jgi:hypothetical protein